MPQQPRKLSALPSLFSVLLPAYLLLTPTTQCFSQANSSNDEGIAESSLAASEAQSIFGEVNSPFCPGRLLRDCPSSAAVSLKEEISAQLAAGRTKEEIKAELFKRYGNEVNPLPEASGFASLAWWGPLVFLSLGLLVIARITRRSKPSRQLNAPAVQDRSLDTIERLIRGDSE